MRRIYALFAANARIISAYHAVNNGRILRMSGDPLTVVRVMASFPRPRVWRRLCTRAVVADEGRQIVVLRSGPLLDRSDDSVRGGGWSKLSRLPQHGGQTLLPEEISLGVGGLDEAVSVEQQAISGFQRVDCVGEGGKVEGREDQAILDDFQHSSAAQQKLRLVLANVLGPKLIGTAMEVPAEVLDSVNVGADRGLGDAVLEAEVLSQHCDFEIGFTALLLHQGAEAELEHR